MDNRENIILCITEGERLDPRILNHLKNIFGFENVKVFPICLNIYNLYQKLTEDNSFDAEFIDTFMLIKEISKGQRNSYNDELLSLERDQISEIFLFFDYDGHDTLVEKHPNCLSKMLSLFNNETEHGKLYVSYPMIESYKHPIDATNNIVDIYSDTHYKTFVSKICDKKLNNLSKLLKEDWLNISILHMKSTNHLFNNSFDFPNSYSDTIEMTQEKIYNQQQKYIVNQKISIINAFPWFLLEYLGTTFFQECNDHNKQSPTMTKAPSFVPIN